jgi:hypothetical protein
MLWGCGTGRCGTLSLARAIDGEHEPSPGLGPDCNVKEVLRGRLERGVPCVDRLHSLVIPQIREIDPDAKILWLVRNPFDTVRSFLDTRHCDVPSSLYYPIPSGLSPRLTGAWVWRHINESILYEIEKGPHEVIATESLSMHEGATRKPPLQTEAHCREIEVICGDLWREIWSRYPSLQEVAA